MTNPDNAIGTNAAYDGRTSVDAFNDDLAAYSRGVLSGWECKVYTGLTVMLGGSSSARDVAIAQDNAGNKTTINNISRDEVLVTVAAAPASNSRIDAIVAYVDNPPQGNSTTADNPSACGIIAVSGTPSATPVEPTDNMIRTAITADGASGTTAYYAVLATVTVPTGTTDLIQGYITQGVQSTTANINIADGSITANKLDFTTLSGNYSTSEINTGFTWVDGKTIYKKTINFGTLPDTTTKTMPHGITNLGTLISVEGAAKSTGGSPYFQLPINFPGTEATSIRAFVDSTDVRVGTGMDRTDYTAYVTLYYTKNS